MNKVYVIGVGPGNRDYLSKKAEAIIKEMDVLIAGRRNLESFAELELKKIEVTLPLSEIKDYILRNYRKEKIAVLVSGDPGLYSLLNYLKREIGQDILEVIPGISALQLAAARIKINWNDLQILSLHGKDNQQELVNLLEQQPKAALFTDNKFPPNKIAKYLRENNIEDKIIFVFENLSYPDEKITAGKVEDIAQLSFADLNLMIVLESQEIEQKMWGDFDGAVEL